MERARGVLTEYKRCEVRIYRQIRSAMAIEGVKQYQVAEELGLHKSTVSQHFDNHTFSLEQILQIFEFLGLELIVCAKD